MSFSHTDSKSPIATVLFAVVGNSILIASLMLPLPSISAPTGSSSRLQASSCQSEHVSSNVLWTEELYIGLAVLS